jgi:hypothetical protein
MQPIEFYLDEILKKLQEDRKKPVSQRSHLNPDIILREIINTDRHEDYLEMIQILKSEGLIKRVNENENMTEINKSRDILITIKGSLLIENGGYTQQKKDNTTILKNAEDRNQRMERNERYLVLWTKRLTYAGWAAAGGTFLLFLWDIRHLLWWLWVFFFSFSAI